MENSSMTKSDFRSFRKIGKDILSNNTLYFLNESLRVMDDLYLPDYCEKVAEALKASIKSQKEKYIMIFRYKEDDLEAWQKRKRCLLLFLIFQEELCLCRFLF